MSANPIGIFDSGIGGLTVATEVARLLPNENIIYFGDTIHLPYGEKTVAQVQGYTVNICKFLLAQECKIILVACHSASSVALDVMQSYLHGRVKLINVIDPVVTLLKNKYLHKTVGLIGTRLTVNSQIYPKKLQQQIDLRALATPKLVPLIETQFNDPTAIQAALTEYLSDASLTDINALILGCTHYPLIKEAIEDFYQTQAHRSVDIIDSAAVAAHYLHTTLMADQLLHQAPASYKKFYISNYTPTFAQMTEKLFGKNIHLVQIDHVHSV